MTGHGLSRTPKRRFQFNERSQLFICVDNETLSVILMRVCNPERSPVIFSRLQIVRPLESTVETQPQLQPALLRLSAIISRYFTASVSLSAFLRPPTV
jgi:hypothetical protein